MKIEITAFGIAKDILQQKRTEIELSEEQSVAALRKTLIHNFPDFEKLADAFGCPGSRVESEAEFRDAIRAAREHAGPSLIIVTENDDWLN